MLKDKKNIFLQILLSMCFVLLIFVPGTLLLTTGAGDVLYGETAYEMPALSVGDWIDGEFQRNFETWFSSRYPGRTQTVGAYIWLESMEGKTEQRILASIQDALFPERNEVELITSLVARRETYAAPEFPEYVMDVPTETTQSSFRGTDAIIVGTDGFLSYNSLINEVFGFSPNYANVTTAYLHERVSKLSVIQEELAQRDIAFLLLITPSKPAYYPEFVPQWYLDKYTMPKEYVRPYTRLLSLLEETDINYIDSADVFEEHGLTNIFPMTGLHWNDLASTLVAQEVMAAYAEQSGETARQLRITGVAKQEGRLYAQADSGYDEQDLFAILYNERPVELEQAIVDPFYYKAVVEVVDPSVAPIKGIWAQGGSFLWGIRDRIYDTGFTHAYYDTFYNTPDTLPDWDKMLSSVSYVVLEVNEQMVYSMGIDQNERGEQDFWPVKTDQYNVHDGLYTYLTSGVNTIPIVPSDN